MSLSYRSVKDQRVLDTVSLRDGALTFGVGNARGIFDNTRMARTISSGVQPTDEELYAALTSWSNGYLELVEVDGDLTAAGDLLDGIPNAEGVDEDVEPDGDDDSDVDVQAEHTGAMIALIPSDADLDRLVLDGGEARDDLHLTLWFLGDAVTYDQQTRDTVVTMVTELALEQSPITASGFGVAVWNPLGEDPCVVMNVGGDQPSSARDEIGEALDDVWAACLPGQHEPWSPHICLVYDASPAPFVAPALSRVGPIIFDKIRVAFADQVTDISLGYTTAMAADTVTLETSAPMTSGVGGVGNTNLPGTVPTGMASDTGAPGTWEGILVIEDVETGDGRKFAGGSLDWAGLPLALRWTEQDFGEHQGAYDVGRIDNVWRDAANPAIIRGSGVFDLGSAPGAEAYRQVQQGFLKGVSVDVDSVKDSDVEFVWPSEPTGGDGEGEMDDLMSLFAAPETMIFHAGRIRAATLVSIPAFVEAQISLTDGTQVMTNSTAATGMGNYSLDEAARMLGRLLSDATIKMDLAERRMRYDTLSRLFADRGLTVPPFSLDALSDEVKALVASGLIATDDYVAPPTDWFVNPGFDQPTPLTVTDDGHVFGHAALWGSCHIGYPDACVTPPEEDDFQHYLLGEVLTSDGARVAVGGITIGTGHAPTFGINARQAVEHYDNTGTRVADVVCGRDKFGIWYNGAIRHGTPAGRVADLRASKLSGDWRRLGGHLRLVALLAVNVPGFGVPRIQTRIEYGVQTSLVAAGMLPDELTTADHAALRRMKERLAARIGRDPESKRAALRARVHKE